ncbi:MAG: TetR/AcrR family transcriptional regulator [Lachnospiraceae bacterium]|nr:TetR/AcrR family transcriptional regulator [Lachnospiraceae bacterium]MBR3736013.1 TetR/AcrR family transcriptional regulator [Lachnospiraceae bacterium]MBR6158341.1 TetR/AcrR family transcriptional regulator [Lachnospiraceae bacterium]
MSVDSVREKVLEAALELFSRKGYDGTSIDEIAVACGMKAPNIYKYFKGKKEIFEIIHSKASENYKVKMNMTSESLVWIHDGEELKKFSMHQLGYTMTDERVRKFRRMYTIEQFRNDNLRDRASDFQLNNIMHQFEEIFKELIKLGAIAECDPEMLAMEYCAPVSLLIQLCDREPERYDEIMVKIEKYIDHFIAKNFIKK